MKGILFKPNMIKAIREGRKTQTRRIVKVKDVDIHDKKWVEAKYNPKYGCCFINDGIRETWSAIPHYQVDEVVYIKEAYSTWGYPEKPFYKDEPNIDIKGIGWHTPLFMPEWASRYHIQIIDVKVERLQDIKEEAKAEGVTPLRIDWDDNISTNVTCSYRDGFIELWDSINPTNPWSSNPWVWVYTFKLVPTQGQQ